MTDDSVVVRFSADTSDLAKSVQAAQSQVKTFGSVVVDATTQATASVGGLEKSFDSMGSGSNRVGAAVDAIGARISALDVAIRGAQARLQVFSTSALTAFNKGMGATLQGLANDVSAAGGLRNFAAASGGILGVTLIGAGFATAAAEAINKLRGIADEAGLTTSQLAGLQSVFSRLGLSSEQTGKALESLRSNLLEAKARGGELKEALDAAGISFQQANGDLRPTIDVLQDIVSKMRETHDASANLTLATKAFGQEMAGPFAAAVGKGGSALDHLQTASHKAGTAILNDLAAMAQGGIAWLDRLWDHMNQVYSRLKELGGLELSGTDELNVAQEHMREAQGHLVNLQVAANLRDVSPEEIKAAWQRIFDAGREIAKASPIPVLPGGDPSEKKVAVTPLPQTATDTDDDGGAGRKRRASSEDDDDDRAADVIQKLKDELAVVTSIGEAHKLATDELKTQEALKRAGVDADSDEGREIASLVSKIDAATEAMKRQKEVAAAIKGEFEKIGSTVSSSIMGMIEGTTTIRGLYRNVARSIVSEMIEANVKIAADFLAKQASQVLAYALGQSSMTAAAVAGESARTAVSEGAMGAQSAAFLEHVVEQIGALAAEAFAGVTAFLSPILGPAAVGPASAVEATVVAAGASLPHFAVGSWSLPGNMVAQVHAGEMIVPAAATPWAQSLMAAAAGANGGSGSGAPTSFTLHHTSYGRRTASEIAAESGAMIEAIHADMKLNPVKWRSSLKPLR